MSDEIFCDCGKTIKYVPSPLGTMVTCSCGREIKIPEEMVEGAAEQPDNPGSYESILQKDVFVDSSEHDAAALNQLIDNLPSSQPVVRPKTKRGYCPRCHEWVQAERQPVAHFTHAAVTFLVSRYWLWFWILRNFNPIHLCPKCQRKTVAFQSILLRWLTLRKTVAAFLLWVGALSVGVYLQQGRDQSFVEAVRLQEAGRFDEAKSRYDALLEKYPKLASAYYNRGLILQQGGKYQEAFVDYQFAIDNADNPDEENLIPDAHQNRADCLLALGDLDQALTEINHALDVGKRSSAALTTRASVYAQLEKPEQASQDYEEALELDPQNADALTGLWQVLSSQDQHQQAIDLVSGFVDRQPDSLMYLDLRAYSQMNLDRHGSAIRDLKSYLKEIPNDPYAWRQQGRCYLVIEQNGQALESLSEAIDLAGDPETFFLRAITYLRLGYPDRAMEDVKRAIELSRDSDRREDYLELQRVLEDAKETPQPESIPIPTVAMNSTLKNLVAL